MTGIFQPCYNLIGSQTYAVCSSVKYCYASYNCGKTRLYPLSLREEARMVVPVKMEKKAEPSADAERNSRSQGWAERESAAEPDWEELTSEQSGPTPYSRRQRMGKQADLSRQPWSLFMDRGFPSGRHLSSIVWDNNPWMAHSVTFQSMIPKERCAIFLSISLSVTVTVYCTDFPLFGRCFH